MGKKKSLKKISFDINDYLKTNKALARLEELERNGGRWIAVDRPHKNKKAYDRKRDKKVDTSYPFNYFIHLH